MSALRSILHVDMDAFFASVEQLDHPEIRGKPVLVGYDGPRGVVAAASYESRVFGCRSAQPMVVAKRKCPQAIVMPVRFKRYHEASEQVFAIFEQATPLIEPLSVDEAFLDVTDSRRLLGTGEEIARSLRETIHRQTGLTASVGVAGNKFLAKLASDMNKPDGLTVITPELVDTVLPPLPVGRIWGIGPKSVEKLAGRGIRTIGDLRQLPEAIFNEWFGSDGERYRRLAFGIDDRPVVSDRQAKSISHEQTFGVDVAEPEVIGGVLLSQVEQVVRRLRKHGLQAKGVSLKIRYGDFQTINRSATLDEPTDLTSDLWKAAKGLFERWPFQPVRLIGMAAERLSQGAGEAGLFPDAAREKQKKLDSVSDQINQKFGKAGVRRGGVG